MNNYLLYSFLIVIILKLIYDYMYNINENFTITGIEYKDTQGNKLNFNEEDLNNLDDSIPELCSSVFNEEQIKLGLGDDIDSEIKLDLMLKNYKLKIKSGETFHEKLNKLEEEVFRQYYGDDSWELNYNKFLKKRNVEKKKIQKSECTKYYDDYIINLSQENNLYLNEDTPVNKDNIKKSINILSYLEDTLIPKQNKSIDKDIVKNSNDELYIRKVQYREKEQYRLVFFNYLINYIYYILLISTLLLLYNNNKLNIYTNFHIYLLLSLLPIFIYPFLYNTLIKIHNELDKNIASSFLKNAYS